VAFRIEFDRRARHSDPLLSYGLIQIGAFTERFESSLSYWSESDYERHWREATGRIVDGAIASCLISSITDPISSHFITWWPLYRLGSEVKVLNQLLFLDMLREAFDARNPYVHVRERETISTEGTPVSEWSTTVEELRRFLESPT
jgi:hypothetical protein